MLDGHRKQNIFIRVEIIDVVLVTENKNDKPSADSVWWR